MIRRACRSGLLLLSMVALPPVLTAGEVLSLRVTPYVASAPANVFITVTVERDEQNRELMVEIDSENYYRSSLVTLEGERAARTYLLAFQGLPRGQHQISAAVLGTRGIRGRMSTTLTVVGGAESE